MHRPHHVLRAALFSAQAASVAAVLASNVNAQYYDDGLSRALNNLNSGMSSTTPVPRAIETPPRPVFFPPDPPPLDTLFVRPGARVTTYNAAPTGLGLYVSEPFYAVLAARLARHDLNARKLDAVRSYYDEKNLLQHNLRADVDYILTQPLAARAPLFAALGPKYDPAILALETRAEEMRAQFFDSDDAWNAARKPPITDTYDKSSDPESVAHVMLGAAFFQNGLSAPQRLVLREIAIEVLSGGESVAAAAAAQPCVFFSPGPSRVLFPADLPAGVAAKLADYQTRKSALRKELYDAVYREDAAWFSFPRTLSFKTLAKQQAPAFAALETLAEEIRRELPPLPPAPAFQPAVALPPVVAERIGALYDRQFAEERALNREFELARASDETIRATTVFNSESRRYELTRTYRIYHVASNEFDRVKPRIDALLDNYDRMDAALTEERNAIRREIAAALGTQERARIDYALADGVRLTLARKSAVAMSEYRLAVLEPGLSPAARRLLFAHAIESLDLPLPRGLLQPRERLLQTASER